MKLETEIENDYVKKAGGYGVESIKFTVDGSRNWPDRINLCPGPHTFFIEFKRSAKDTPRKGQLSKHKYLRGFGYNVYVAWTVEDALDFLELELMGCHTKNNNTTLLDW